MSLNTPRDNLLPFPVIERKMSPQEREEKEICLAFWAEMFAGDQRLKERIRRLKRRLASGFEIVT